MQSIFLGAIFGHIIQTKTRSLLKLGIYTKQYALILLWPLPDHLNILLISNWRCVDIVYKPA